MCNVSVWLRFKEITKICAFLVFDFLCDRFPTMVRIRCVIVDTHLAHVDFGATGFAGIQTLDRKREIVDRLATLPTNK